ncbi:MAG: RNA-protein complex protein Nop10 [Sulfolobales archaeon]
MTRWLLRKCVRCKAYTLQEICPKCGGSTSTAHPPRFSPNDRYVRHRVILKSINDS